MPSTPPRKRPAALTVAGLDPSGGAGVLADVRTFEALGVHGAAVVAALTVQDSARVSAVRPVPAQTVADSLRAVLADLAPAAAKTGMLATDSVVDAVAGVLGEARSIALVVDPVRRSSSGAVLLDDDGWKALLDRLVPLARLVTPNRAEAEEMSGVSIGSLDDATQAARRIAERGAAAVLVKGGHGPSEQAVDVLYEATPAGGRLEMLEAPRVPGDFRGTGCILSAAIAALLAEGRPLVESVRLAKGRLWDALGRAAPAGHGGRIVRL